MKLTDKDLKERGFKKKWLQDKSGYWWEQKFPKTLIGKLQIQADPEWNSMYIERPKDSDSLISGKCTLAVLKKILTFINKIK